MDGEGLEYDDLPLGLKTAHPGRGLKGPKKKGRLVYGDVEDVIYMSLRLRLGCKPT